MKKLVILVLALVVTMPLYAVRYNFNADFGVKPGDKKSDVLSKFKSLGITLAEKNNLNGGKYYESLSNVVLRGDTITVKLAFKKNILHAMFYIYDKKGWKKIQPLVDSLVTYRADRAFESDDGFMCVFDTMVMSIVSDDYTLLFFRSAPEKPKKKSKK